jgi:hypothetical protein
MNRLAFKHIVLLWLAWVVLVIGFQAWSTARFQPQWPDKAQDWTEKYTGEDYQSGRPYLMDPFLNDQVAWDSEYYIGIATGGYDDPKIPHLTPSGTTTFDYHMMLLGNEYYGESTSLAYAFFPLYPAVMWLFTVPLSVIGLNPAATSTLAGVLVSALGALGGMLALYDLTRDSLEHDGAMRAVFYLIIFPTAFFMVQVYTEGLFVGLAFGCLAMLKRRGWYLIPAAILAAAATLTRAVGVALIIPMAIDWFRTGDWLDIDLEWGQAYYLARNSFRCLFRYIRFTARRLWSALRVLFRRESLPSSDWFRFYRDFGPVLKFYRSLGKMLLAFAPFITFLIWKFSWLGVNFDFVEARYFGRGFLDFGTAFYLWATPIKQFVSGAVGPEHVAYYLTEFLGLVVGVTTCIACIRRQPQIAWFSLAVLVISWGSGPAQGIQRYILGAPAVFYMLSYWFGKRPVLDRAWTILSTMLMGFLAMLFAFNMWVA